MMIKLFNTKDYKAFVRAHISALKNAGRGEYRRIAANLRIHPSLVSQIFNGDKQLTAEQACALAEHMGLTAMETDYFVALVELDRAGSAKLRSLIQKRVEEMQRRAGELSSRLPTKAEFSEEVKATFYSQWYYSAVRNLTSIPGYDNISVIAERLKLPKALVTKIVEFLVQHGLCVEKDGKILLGTQRTHVAADSPHAARHHMNWRVKAMERHSTLSQHELAYTSPMTLSAQGAAEVRTRLVEIIGEIGKLVADSPSEQLYCLSLDWFEPAK